MLTDPKEVEIVILTLGKTGFKIGKLIRDNQWHYVMIKRTNFQQDIILKM